MSPVIRQETLDSPTVQSLIRALNAELDERYPEEGANHFRLDPTISGRVAAPFSSRMRRAKPLAAAPFASMNLASQKSNA